MKYYILLLPFIFIMSCSNTEKCNLNFERRFNKNFIKLWNSETRKAMVKKGDEKSIFLLNFEKKYNLSLFDRSGFVSTPKLINESDKHGFSELWVLEINYAGEKNQIVKYLIGVCRNESYVTRYLKGINGWGIFESHKIKTGYFRKLCTALNGNDENSSYWGNNITEIGCLTQFKNGNQISVQLFGALNKEQFDAITGLNLR